MATNINHFYSIHETAISVERSEDEKLNCSFLHGDDELTLASVCNESGDLSNEFTLSLAETRHLRDLLNQLPL